MKHDTLLFDMDGTLFDTEKIYHAAWNSAGIPDSLYHQFIGRDRPHIFALIRENTRYDPAVVQARKDAYVRQALKDSVPIKPQLVETLQQLTDGGYHCCIATSSAREVAERYLALTNTARFFEQVISGNTLPHGKPAPDIYLLAARIMHAVPAQCVVIEDSYNGVRAGHAAGMATVMIPDEIPADAEMKQLSAAVLENLGQLPALLRKLDQLN